MREVEYTNQFERDFKRVEKNPDHKDLSATLEKLIEVLQIDDKLPRKYFDHPLRGEYTEFRECHLKPDLRLIYGKEDPKVLKLIRLGSHSMLF